MLTHVCDLRDKIVIFSRQEHFVALAEMFSREDFNAKTAYLADIFDSLNCLNLSMHDAGFTVIDHDHESCCLLQKVLSPESYAARGQYMFPELTKYISGNKVDIKQTMIGYLEQLAQKFVDYSCDDLLHTNEND